MTPIQLGLIGCSSIAERRFLPALARSDAVTLVAVGSRSHEKARAYRDAHGAQWAGSYDEVLAAVDVDAVYISTPAAMQARWVLTALAAGKHVLCEKPTGVDSGEALRMVHLAATCHRLVYQGYMFRFHPQHAAVREMINAGEIGSPWAFRSGFTYPRPAEPNIRLDPDLGGGVFLDSMGYTVAAARLFFGEPVAGSATLQMDRGSGVDRLVAGQLTFPGGRVAQLMSGFGLQYRSDYEIHGSEGILRVARAYSVSPEHCPVGTLETNDGIRTLEFPQGDQFRRMIDDFATSLSGGEREWSIRTQELLAQHRAMDLIRSTESKTYTTIQEDSR